MLQDGYTDIPRGRIAATVTYLARDLALAVPAPDWPRDVTLARLTGETLGRYRSLFRAVGQDWLWFSRLLRTDAELHTIIDNPLVEALCLQQGGQDIGLMELDFRAARAADIAYFGLVPGVIGAGLGRAMMADGLARAKARGYARITVNTCSLDHPRALDFYGRSGFVAEKRAIEIFPDPRLTGLLPRDAARHIPIID